MYICLQDFIGQKNAEYLFRIIITTCGVSFFLYIKRLNFNYIVLCLFQFAGFILGYIKEQFSITIGLTLIGFFISALVSEVLMISLF